MGGKWTLILRIEKYPAKKIPLNTVQKPILTLKKQYLMSMQFSNNLGELTDFPLYPNSFSDSRNWLNQFLEQHFSEFGVYEDAIVAENSLNHSVLTHAQRGLNA